MKTKVYAVTGTAIAALSATVAFGQWAVPFALSTGTQAQSKSGDIDLVDASAAEVLDWMKKSGISFVVESSAIPSDKRFTVHLKGQSHDAAMEAIASALGLNLAKKGEVYNLTRSSERLFINPLDSERWAKELGEKWSQQGKEWEKFGEKFGKEGQWTFKTIPDGKKYFKDMPDGEWKLKELPDMDQLLKDLPDIKLRFKDMQDNPEWQKHLKDLPKIELRLNESLKSIPKIDLKGLEKLKELKNLPDVHLGLGDIGGLMESLTPQQMDKCKSRGYLTPDDLTREQRKLLGDFPNDSKFEIVFEKDGKKVTIKGK